MNLRLNDTMIINVEEETVEASKSRKRQRKIEDARRNEKETLKADKILQKATGRVKISQDKLDILSQSFEAVEE